MNSEIIGSVDPSWSLMRLFGLFLDLLWASITSHVMAKQSSKPAGRSANDTRNYLAVKYVSESLFFICCQHCYLSVVNTLTPSPTGHTAPKEKEGRGRR